MGDAHPTYLHQSYLANQKIHQCGQETMKKRSFFLVQDVTNPESPNFVKPSDRIAVFDNDGTLWTEKPCFFEEALIVHQQESLEADSNGCLKDKITEDIALKNIEVNSGIETEKYKTNARNFLDTELHPRFGVPYIQLTYQPMVQLLDYLREQEFQIYISSGGEIDFIRSFAEDAYKVTPPNVIGTSFLSKFEITEEGEPILIRLRIPVLPINNYDGKAIGIERYISKKPIIAVGNSDGDVAMLQYTDNGKGRNLMMLVHHDTMMIVNGNMNMMREQKMLLLRLNKMVGL